MLHRLASFLNETANAMKDKDRLYLSANLYRLSSILRPEWSFPWYNLGFQWKYQGKWAKSLSCNQRAAELDPADEASWWNLGIAATALGEWPEARRAWSRIGIELREENGELCMTPATACVRLDPINSGEVVWGTRIDPARMVIDNVPLPTSSRRYKDIVLNDGAQEGTRTIGVHEYPVFNELGIWKASMYSTFEATVLLPTDNARKHLEEACERDGIGYEDWSRVRMLCRDCSFGKPGPHECVAATLDSGVVRYGFAALSQESLSAVLGVWEDQEAGARFSDLRVVLSAR